jgi:hypothetical protein
MRDSFRGSRVLRFLWYEQRGLCVLCQERITRITGWRLHHCVPRVMGGSTSAENRVLLHPECTAGSIASVFTFPNRVPSRAAFEGRLSCVRGNFHAQFLEGWTGAILSGYSVLKCASGQIA